MQRRLFTLVIFLLLGAVVNVAVACALTAWIVVGEGSAEAGSILTPAGETVPYLYWKQRGIERIKWHLFLARGDPPERFPIRQAPTWSEVATRRAYNDNRHPFFVNVRGEVASGWPLLSMRSCHAVKPTGGTRIYEPPMCAVTLSDHRSPPSWHLARGRALPLIPIWPGIFGNTAFYSMLLWLLICGPFALRQHIRRKRGLCVACGYDLRHADHEACPECGAAVPLQRAVAPRIEQWLST
ncbi:MAG: hypothetical protein O7D91_09610 [Planctomycetota bacterium]|nr:hypothetical protein [Planctomycetota bacterium]